MVAFGLWLGEVPEPPPLAIARPAPGMPAAHPLNDVPPMVLLPAAATPAAAPAATPAPLASARPRVATVIKKPPLIKRRVVTASSTPARLQARTRAPAFGERNRFAAIDSGEGQRIRCKHGELARECLARYR
jgi:hypothetical protein